MPSNGAAAANSSGNLTLLATKSSPDLAQQNHHTLQLKPLRRSRACHNTPLISLKLAENGSGFGDFCTIKIQWSQCKTTTYVCLIRHRCSKRAKLVPHDLSKTWRTLWVQGSVHDEGLPLVKWSCYLVSQSKDAEDKYQYRDKVVFPQTLW